MIEGAKYDIASILSGNFNVVHSLTWGSSQSPPSYHFGATYMVPQVRAFKKLRIQMQLTGQVDHSGGLMARGQYNWIPVPVPQPPQPEKADQPPAPPSQPEITSTTKFQAQMPAGGMGQRVMQLEHEHVGKDFSVTVKGVNPNPLEAAPNRGMTAVPETYTISGLQSVSKNLALGGELSMPRGSMIFLKRRFIF